MNQTEFVTKLCDAGDLGDAWMGPLRRRAARAAVGEKYPYAPVLNARRECLILGLLCWEPGDTKRQLEAKVERAWKNRYGQKYGSVVLAFILLTILGAAISWAVQRLLDKWFPHHSTAETQALQSAWRKAAGKPANPGNDSLDSPTSPA